MLWLIIVPVIRRHITGHVLAALADAPAVLVNGVRRTVEGKRCADPQKRRPVIGVSG